MALIVGAWLWGKKYHRGYVERLQRGLNRNLARTFRFMVFETTPADDGLRAGCLCRLRMFSPEWQRRHGIEQGDRLVCLDLDLVITGPVGPVFDRDESFVILQGANSANPCPFNGSVMMLRAGAHREVWDSFSIEKAREVPYYEFPDDQGWLWHMLPQAAGWSVGAASGIFAFRKPGWPKGDDANLPPDARIVSFPGARDPSQFMYLPWVREHWR